MMKTKKDNSHWFNSISFHRGLSRALRKSIIEDASTTSTVMVSSTSLDVQLHRRCMVNSSSGGRFGSHAAQVKPLQDPHVSTAVIGDPLSQGIHKKNRSFQSDESWHHEALRASLFLQEEELAAQREPEAHHQRIVIRETDDDPFLAY